MQSNQVLEFICAAKDCGQPVRFSLDEVENNPSLHCPACGRDYKIPPPVLQKLRYLRELIQTVRKVQPILGESRIAIEVGGHKVTIPYYLLLTRMTTELALNFEGYGLEFHFFVEPLNEYDSLVKDTVKNSMKKSKTTEGTEDMEN